MTRKISLPPNILGGIGDYLEEKRQDMERRLSTLRKEDPFDDKGRVEDNAAIDTESREQEGHQRIQALQQELSKNLVRIKKALTKINIGKYGLCDRCREMIDTDRLAIMPEAELCLKCEKKKERR